MIAMLGWLAVIVVAVLAPVAVYALRVRRRDRTAGWPAAERMPLRRRLRHRHRRDFAKWRSDLCRDAAVFAAIVAALRADYEQLNRKDGAR